MLMGTKDRRLSFSRRNKDIINDAKKRKLNNEVQGHWILHAYVFLYPVNIRKIKTLNDEHPLVSILFPLV